jgi:hypothetical protein
MNAVAIVAGAGMGLILGSGMGIAAEVARLEGPGVPAAAPAPGEVTASALAKLPLPNPAVPRQAAPAPDTLRIAFGVEHRRGDLLFGPALPWLEADGGSGTGEGAGAGAGAGPEADGGRPPGVLPDWTAPFLDLEADAGVWRSLRVATTLTSTGRSESLPHGVVRRLEMRGRVGPFEPWAGRRSVAWGPGASGGVLLAGHVPLDGGGLSTARPIQLPGRGARIGTFQGDFLLARVSDNGPIGSPWLMAQQLVWTPAPPVAIHLRKASMFGGEGAARVTLGRFLGSFVGAHVQEDGRHLPFDNQVATVGVVLSGRGMQGGMELGMEDSSGAWKRSPALQGFVEWGADAGAGVDAGSGPAIGGPAGDQGATGIAFRLERTYFSRPNGHGRWYHHSTYRGGWSDRGIPLGHPLGGGGTEWRVEGRGPLAGRGALSVHLATRYRDPSNGFASHLEGRRWGGGMDLRIPLKENWSLIGQGRLEMGGERAEANEGGRGLTQGAIRLGAAWRPTRGGAASARHIRSETEPRTPGATP